MKNIKLEKIFLCSCMLLPGIFFDIIYYLRYNFIVADKFVAFFSVIFKPLGVTYTTAFDIIRNNIGVLMTMVSLFLTMNLNVAERSEKKVFGMTYKEIDNKSNNNLYFGVKYISYAAPVIMIIAMNLHFCITGYLLFAYCYGFLVWHYYIHASSYSREISRKKVVKKILNYLSNAEEMSYDAIQQFDMYLYELRKSVSVEGNWKEIEVLYNEIIGELLGYDLKVKRIVFEHFYKIVYWKQKPQNEIATYRIWSQCLDKIDEKIAKEGSMCEDDEILFWSMMEVIIYETTETQLIMFLNRFLKFKFRSRRTIQVVGNELNEKVLCEQSCLIVVLLERRLRQISHYNFELQGYTKKLMDYGYRVFLDEIERENVLGMIRSLYAEDCRDMNNIHTIIKDLLQDFENKSTRCFISGI